MTEAHSDGGATRAVFRCRAAFRRAREESVRLPGGVLLDEEGFRVRCAFLDHQIPCLVFALEEKQHLNVWKNRRDELGLSIGPWLREIKQAVRRNDPDDRPLRVTWRADGREHERVLALGELRRRVLQVVPGQKIVYVTDAIYHAENAARITALARAADVLFIETPFLQQDAARAAGRYHLTARQAGLLARAAGVKAVVPFHFSPRYRDAGQALRADLARAFGRP